MRFRFTALPNRFDTETPTLNPVTEAGTSLYAALRILPWILVPVVMTSLKRPYPLRLSNVNPLPLVAHRELMPALGTAAGKNPSARLRSHPGPKSVRVAALSLMRLKRPFHQEFPLMGTLEAAKLAFVTEGFLKNQQRKKFMPNLQQTHKEKTNNWLANHGFLCYNLSGFLLHRLCGQLVDSSLTSRVRESPLNIIAVGISGRSHTTLYYITSYSPFSLCFFVDNFGMILLASICCSSIVINSVDFMWATGRYLP
jgi:hypothetical protein